MFMGKTSGRTQKSLKIVGLFLAVFNGPALQADSSCEPLLSLKEIIPLILPYQFQGYEAKDFEKLGEFPKGFLWACQYKILNTDLTDKGLSIPLLRFDETLPDYGERILSEEEYHKLSEIEIWGITEGAEEATKLLFLLYDLEDKAKRGRILKGLKERMRNMAPLDQNPFFKGNESNNKEKVEEEPILDD